MSLQNEWYIVCESRRLKDVPIAARLFATDFVLWRDTHGVAHAAVDRCAHRNAPLSQGSVKAGCLVCPYHGWKYAGSGECQHIPSLAEGRPIPTAARLASRSVCEQDGFVWLCPGEAPAHAPRAFPHCDETGWTTFRMRTRFDSNVEACLENFLDCPHTATVHKGWFRNPDPREMDAVVRKGPDSVAVSFENEPTTDSFISRLFYPKNCPLTHTDQFLMPNLSRVDYRFDDRHHFIITSQASPIDEWTTEVSTVITFRYGRIGWLVRLAFEPMSRHIIQQDVDILKLQGSNLRRFDGPAYTHVETDLIALHMQALRRRAERGEAPGPEITEKRIRLRF